jgi:predicted Zn-dependent protease
MTAADQAALRQALVDANAGRADAAEPVLRRLASRYPENDQASEALGLLYAENGSIREALPLLRRACRDAPRSAVDHANLGTAWLKLGNVPLAARQLSLAARLDPNNRETLSALGQAEMMLRNWTAAEKAFARAGAIGPAPPDLLYNWAVALADEGLTQRAAEVLARIPEGEKSDQAESLAGDLDEILGHPLAAVRHDQRAAQMNPSEANLYALCVEYLRHWTWPDAEKTAEYGVARYPRSVQLQLALGVALYGEKNFPRSAHVFAALLAREPNSDMVAEMLGRTCAEMAGGNAGCLGLVDFAARHPANAAAAVYASQQILDRPDTSADLDEVARLLSNARTANPQNADAWYETGLLDADRSQWQASADALRKATALAPGNAAAHYHLAIAWDHLGREKARQQELALFASCSRKEKDAVDKKVRAMTVFLIPKS